MTDPRHAPRRIQRKRTKGWKMPPNTIYVGRPSIYGNPFQIGKHYQFNREGWLMALGKPAPNEVLVRDRAHAIELFRRFFIGLALPPSLKALRGKNLACWCPLDQPCHADVLLELANAD